MHSVPAGTVTVKRAGPLIPAGDGEGLPQRPAPDLRLRPPRLRSRGTSVPTEDEIKQLPHAVQVAFAARCALRVNKPVSSPAEVVQCVEEATIDMLLMVQLRRIRRDCAP